jgi:hypothetical protein
MNSIRGQHGEPNVMRCCLSQIVAQQMLIIFFAGCLCCRGAAAAIIVYDITSTDSFTRAKAWVRELQRQGSPNMIMALAGGSAHISSDALQMSVVGVQCSCSSELDAAGRCRQGTTQQQLCPSRAQGSAEHVIWELLCLFSGPRWQHGL